MTDTSTQSYSDQNSIHLDSCIFLGTIDFCRNHTMIDKYNIKRVLSIIENPLKTSEKFGGVYYKMILMSDFVDCWPELAIIHFDECFHYITESVKYNENILIHGSDDSDSSSLGPLFAAAYLMKKFQLSTTQVIRIMAQKSISEITDSNLIDVLDLWHRMAYRLRPTEQAVRLLCLNFVRTDFDKIFIYNDNWPEDFCEVYLDLGDTYKQFIIQLDDDDDEGIERESYYGCAKCGLGLFIERNIIRNDAHYDCKYIYIEPKQFSFNQAEREAKKSNSEDLIIFGRIRCPKCSTTIGNYDWQRDLLCQCPLHQGLDDFLIYQLDKSMIKTIR